MLLSPEGTLLHEGPRGMTQWAGVPVPLSTQAEWASRTWHSLPPWPTVTAVFLLALPLPRLQLCAEAVWLTEISRKLIVFHIQTWLPAQAQECQSQHKRKAKPTWLGEEKGGSSPMPVYICAAHPDTVQWALLQHTLDKASVQT